MKKVVALLLAICMLVTILTGCKSKNNTPTETDINNSIANNSTNGDRDFIENSTNGSNKVDYNKGYMSGEWYINEWADMRFFVSDNWEQGTDEMYKIFEIDVDVDCGLLLHDDSTETTLLISYEKLNGQAVSSSEYLDVVTSKLVEKPKNTFSDVYTLNIANKQFQTVTLSAYNENKGKTRFARHSAHKKEDYMIYIFIDTYDDLYGDSILADFETVN